MIEAGGRPCSFADAAKPLHAEKLALADPHLRKLSRCSERRAVLREQLSAIHKAIETGH